MKSRDDRESCKLPVRARGRRSDLRGVARSLVLLQEIIVARHRIPLRRPDLDWFAVLTDPLTRLRRPVSDVTSPTRIILEDDGAPVLRCGLDRLAHAKTPVLIVLCHFQAMILVMPINVHRAKMLTRPVVVMQDFEASDGVEDQPTIPATGMGSVQTLLQPKWQGQRALTQRASLERIANA